MADEKTAIGYFESLERLQRFVAASGPKRFDSGQMFAYIYDEASPDVFNSGGLRELIWYTRLFKFALENGIVFDDSVPFDDDVLRELAEVYAADDLNVQIQLLPPAEQDELKKDMQAIRSQYLKKGIVPR